MGVVGGRFGQREDGVWTARTGVGFHFTVSDCCECPLGRVSFQRYIDSGCHPRDCLRWSKVYGKHGGWVSKAFAFSWLTPTHRVFYRQDPLYENLSLFRDVCDIRSGWDVPGARTRSSQIQRPVFDGLTIVYALILSRKFKDSHRKVPEAHFRPDSTSIGEACSLSVAAISYQALWHQHSSPL